MILTGLEIEKQVKSGRIHISPYIRENINPNSYNYRLAPIIYELQNGVIDSKQKTSFKRIEIPKEGLVLVPNKLYLGSTVEEIGSDYYVTQLIGRSSVGRLGLFLQITAPLGHLGAKHCWTLELTTVQPLKVYAYMKIGQVSFWEVQGETSLYNGLYHKYNEPHISEFYNKLALEVV
ncbi:deoxycytidine triphosphate deaminase [Paenibacillus baekrokdamisoli]|uniref:Deoxycytidine triphosphate deaminase n=1 Tax=Paenibacillus baekrokdamisoli TaxID=1712516 RepID=A0A3G9JHS6_9BACL|nr:deoxycytidine deaminase [Paenibacillus baekrokdamisoli]MBB3068371.1 dCTP deaminase [Paenibacillus baekrokdamisoli]BBH22584.1 deoxycytidine triphosphate deaminase [Paenibacillus baekrokdamisoli]